MFDKATISSVFTFGMTCWGGNAAKQDKNRFDKNIKQVGGVVVRRQESIDIVTKKLRTILADEAHPLRPEFDNRHTQTGAIGVGFLVLGQLDTYSRSFQRPFGHTINKQADKRNTRRQGVGVRGRRSWG